MQIKFERFLTSEFTCDAPADVSDICGIDIDQDADGVSLSQTRYIKKVMADFSIPAVTVLQVYSTTSFYTWTVRI